MAWVIKKTSGVKAVLLGASAVAAAAMPSGAAAQAAPTSCSIASQIQLNGGFELPNIPNNGNSFQSAGNVPGWSTTDLRNQIEIWHEGFTNGGRFAATPAFEGDQFAEINANDAATLTQTGAVASRAELLVTWAHRARPATNGSPQTNTAQAVVADDTGNSVSTGNFSATNSAWVEHSQLLLIGEGATQFTMQFSAVGGASAGNFLDGVVACQTFITISAAELSRDDLDGSGGDSAGDKVNIQYTVSNPAGNLRPLEDVTIQDNELGNFSVTSPASGDSNGNGFLDPGETWIVVRQYMIMQDDMDNAETLGFTVDPEVTATGDTGDNVLSTEGATYSFPITPIPVVAINDSVTGADGVNGESNVLNVLTGDTVDGNAATTTNASLSVATGSTVPPELTFDTATGNVSVVAGAPPGPYSFDYEICEQANPANCEIATATVNVASAPQLEMTKVADDDEFATVGQIVSYTYTITNTGNEIVRDVTVGDTHNGSGPAPTPAGETLTTDNGIASDSTDATANDGIWDVLAPNDVVTFTGTYTVTQADIDNLQ